ncbi:MAG: undecaprenyl-phosphate alpha-N-acetylglucosaminyl 1-phosphate transferase, partial [Sideroxyarcus sp.]|nr:undecaprenyl-phosphate alpha-N-acetylglucosaminyl 1-phosphate transferase [Sideroxyarcus sp.]
ALLILGLPILDVAWSIIRRMRSGRSPASADRKHLHHRLLDMGFSHRNAVLFLYFLTAVFGFSTLFVTGTVKVIVLIALVALMVCLVFLAVRQERRAQKHPYE